MTAAAKVNENIPVTSLNANWLDNTTSTNCITMYPYNYGWVTYTGKVRLTLTEIEKLRAAANKDKQIKEILSKFTNHIEIEVDFP